LPDTFLRLLSNDGATVATTDDDSGAGLNSFISYTPTATGTYYLSAQAFSSNVGTYRLSEATAGPAQLSPSASQTSFIGGSDSLLALSTASLPLGSGLDRSNDPMAVPFTHGVMLEAADVMASTLDMLRPSPATGTAPELNDRSTFAASFLTTALSQTAPEAMLSTHHLG